MTGLPLPAHGVTGLGLKTTTLGTITELAINILETALDIFIPGT